MFLACLGFGLPSLHGEDVRSQSLHFHHIVIVELLAFASVVVHPVEYNVCMVIRLEPFFTYLEALLVLYIRLSVQPMPLVLMQEKERERKGKNGKIIKVAGCSPIREGTM